MTEKSFAFASKRNAPFFFVSASDGTNVVQLFEEAIKLAVKCKAEPPDDFFAEVLNFLDKVFVLHYLYKEIRPNKIVICVLSFICSCSCSGRGQKFSNS